MSKLKKLEKLILKWLIFFVLFKRNFTQEPSNKLIECRECTRLFHQQCHQPRIELEELEPSSSNGDEKQMSWYLTKCSGCRSTKDADEEVSRINTTSSSSKLAPFSSKLNGSVSKQSTSPILTNGKVKGLASLANKFIKPPSPEELAKKTKLSVANHDLKTKSKPVTNGMIKLGAPAPKKIETKPLLNGKEKKLNGVTKSTPLSVTRSKITWASREWVNELLSWIWSVRMKRWKRRLWLLSPCPGPRCAFDMSCAGMGYVPVVSYLSSQISKPLSLSLSISLSLVTPIYIYSSRNSSLNNCN